MTRREERLERSRRRAEEHQRRRRIRLRIFVVSLTLYTVVPLLWYGGVEFGLVHPIRTPEFQRAASWGCLILCGIWLSLLGDAFSWLSSRYQGEKKKEKRAGVKPTTEQSCA